MRENTVNCVKSTKISIGQRFVVFSLRFDINHTSQMPVLLNGYLLAVTSQSAVCD